MVLAIINPKTPIRKNFLRLSLAACWLYTTATLWSADHLTDGVVSRHELYAAAPQIAIQGESFDDALAELVSAGEFHALEEDGQYRIADFLETNRSKADVMAKREAEHDRYQARQAARHRARKRNDWRSRSGVTDQQSRSIASSSTSAGDSPRRPNESLPADCQQTATAPSVPPLQDSSSLKRISDLRDHPDQTTSGAAGGVGHHHSDLNSGERAAEADPQVSAIPTPDKSTRVRRRDYQPSQELWARWHERVTPKQWLDTLDRYWDKGVDDLLLYKEHESRFAHFIKSTLRFAAMHANERQARLERRESSAVCSADGQHAAAESLSPSVTQSDAPPAPKRALSYEQQMRQNGKMVYDDPVSLTYMERFRLAYEAKRARQAEEEAIIASLPKPWELARDRAAKREAEAKAKAAEHANA